MLGTKISQVRALGSLQFFLERGLVCTFVPGRKMVGRFEGPVSSSALTFFMMRVFNESLHS